MNFLEIFFKSFTGQFVEPSPPAPHTKKMFGNSLDILFCFEKSITVKLMFWFLCRILYIFIIKQLYILVISLNSFGFKEVGRAGERKKRHNRGRGSCRRGS